SLPLTSQIRSRTDDTSMPVGCFQRKCERVLGGLENNTKSAVNAKQAVPAARQKVRDGYFCWENRRFSGDRELSGQSRETGGFPVQPLVVGIFPRQLLIETLRLF